MAFDSTGLFHAQLAATLDYADDQGVQLDDFEHRLVNGDRYLDVEIYFSSPRRTIVHSHGKRIVTDTEIRFVTMFQSLTYLRPGESGLITVKDDQRVDSEFTPLSHIDQLRLLSMAVEQSTL